FVYCYLYGLHHRLHRFRLFPYTTLFRSQRLHQAGVNGLRELDAATEGLYGAEDVGAVIAYRLDLQRPEETPNLVELPPRHDGDEDRKSTRLNSSHDSSSYAVFYLNKKNI